MNFKFTNLVLTALLLFFIFRFVFSPRKIDKANVLDAKVDLSGQEFRAPVSKLEMMPLFREIDFEDSEKIVEEQEVVIYGKNCDYIFSTYGGVLSGVEFKDYKNEFGNPIRTIYPLNLSERSGGGFLVALDKKTPFMYSLLDQGSDDDFEWVRFTAENSLARITKTFVVPKSGFSIKLKCDVIPKKGNAVRPRIVMPAPRIGSIVDDKPYGLYLDVDGKTIIQIKEDQEEGMGWKLPKIFGAQNKYFLHAVYNTIPESSIKRAYVQRIEGNDLNCFLELDVIDEPFSVELDIYIGPKTVDTLKNADPRLIEVLSFGWLDWVCEKLIELIEWLKNNLTGNYGLAVVLVALLTRFILMPLTFFARRRFNDITSFEIAHSAQIAQINNAYKNDFVKRAEELNKFYSRYGKSQSQKTIRILPLLMEIPVIFAAYKILSNYISFYQSSFLWVKDLSARDPYLILPVLFGVVLLVKERISKDPTQGDTGVVKFVMPLFMIVLFSNFPSGLVLYLLSNHLFSAMEELFMDFVIKKYSL